MEEVDVKHQATETLSRSDRPTRVEKRFAKAAKRIEARYEKAKKAGDTALKNLQSSVNARNDTVVTDAVAAKLSQIREDLKGRDEQPSTYMRIPATPENVAHANVLGLDIATINAMDPDQRAETIRNAFRTLAKQHHTDTSGKEETVSMSPFISARDELLKV